MTATGDNLADGHAERELFLHSLREYSESCPPGTLHSSCPFAIATASGVRGCGEECMDILGRHNAPDPVESVDMGDGLTLHRMRRPRSRRPTFSNRKAFDARELHLADRSSGPPQRWSLSSILQEMREVVQTNPGTPDPDYHDRLGHMTTLCAIAEARGLDVESQVLPFLRESTVGAILGSIVISRIRTSGHDDETHSGPIVEWIELVDAHLGPAEPGSGAMPIGDLLGQVIQPVRSWASGATINDLTLRTPPGTPLSALESNEHSGLELLPDDQWLFDRLTETYLENWTKESLAREWRYLHGKCAPPCSAAELSVREVTEGDLAVVMADRLANEVRPRPDLVRSLIDPAAEFLRDGRRPEAAALFEAALSLNPESTDAMNNLGFCLLPDQPTVALGHIDNALSTASSPNADVFRLNKMLALVKLGRVTSALDLGKALLEDLDASNAPHTRPVLMWLWDIESVLGSGPPTLISTRDVRKYAEGILDWVRMSERAGWLPDAPEGSGA